LYFLAQSHPLLKRGIILGIILVGVAGILQYLLLPDVSFLSAFDWDDHYYRLVSTFLDPGFTGVILLIGLVASHNPLFFIVIMLTYSRATYLAYLFSFAVLAIYQKSVKVFVIAALALAIALPLLPKSTGEGTKLSRENSIYARINNWKESISIWQKSPIFGVGYNTYRYVRTGVTAQSHSGAGADSSILFVLATTGVVGLLTYLYLLLTMARLGKNNPTFLAIMAGVFVHSWFNNTLFYPFVLECLWVLLGSRGEST
jgi:O-antigen ligase